MVARFRIAALLVTVVGCRATSALSPTLETAPANASAVRIEMTAEQFKFTPDIVRVKEGSRVTIELVSKDVTHGFTIPDMGINVLVPPGEKTKVEFYASEPGTHEFHCSHFCGLGHGRMSGTLIVEPKSEGS